MPDRVITFRIRARRLRREQTDAEHKLWVRLRSRQVNGAKFRRQHPIGRYIVDFCCPERGIVIELDGVNTPFRLRRISGVLSFSSNEGIGCSVSGIMMR